MAKAGENGLLPEGLRDALPPEAAHEDSLVRRLVDLFMANGYERVAPPLIEFEQSLLARLDKASHLDMFRLLDADSQQVMALRSDMTGQVARIATTRLGHFPRPLRLSYAGTALRVRGSQLRPERQIRQAGVELIGPDSQEARLEVLLLAYEALSALGIGGVSFDLTMPGFVPQLCDELGLGKDLCKQIRAALDSRDIGALAGLGEGRTALFKALLAAAGAADQALKALAKLDLPPKSAALRAQLIELVGRLKAAAPGLEITVDLGEHRGFAYQSAFGFTIYARETRGELGRGGSYGIRRPDGAVEPATGFTLYLDGLCRAAPASAPAPRLLLPLGFDRGEAHKLQAKGWITIHALNEVEDLAAEARRLKCTHVWRDGQTHKL